MTNTTNQNKSVTIADKFLEHIKSSLSVEIDGSFVRCFEEEVHSTSGDPDENVLEFYLENYGDVFVTNTELSLISFDDGEQAFNVGGYTFKFFELKNVGM
jgi:hypothetical protein